MTTFWQTLQSPPTEFSVIPFWFWNDDLDADELRRQIADFQAHGVHGFLIHPRVGLPRSLGWMSEKLLSFYDIAIMDGMDVWLLFNERSEPLTTNVHLAGAGRLLRVDPATGERAKYTNGGMLSLAGYELTLLVADAGWLKTGD